MGRHYSTVAQITRLPTFFDEILKIKLLG